MTYRLIVRAEAQADIDAATDWYANERSDLPERFLQRLTELFQRISTSPLQFPRVGDGVHRALFRGFPYAIYFLVEPERAIVIAVLHLHRAPDTWIRRISRE